jgi:hypothetical protein
MSDDEREVSPYTQVYLVATSTRTNAYAITINNIEMDFVQVFLSFFDQFVFGRVVNGGIVANGSGQFTATNQRSISTGGSDVELVFKLAAAKDAMEPE